MVSAGLCRPYGTRLINLIVPGTDVPGYRLCRPRSISSGQALRDCFVFVRAIDFIHKPLYIPILMDGAAVGIKLESYRSSAPDLWRTVRPSCSIKSLNLLGKGSDMAIGRAHVVAVGLLALSFSSLHAQSPQQIIQQVVDVERKADQNDHSNWIYLEESDKPKEHLVQWVAATQRGNVERVLEKNEQQMPAARQQEMIEKFLHDTRAQNKQVEEANHDNRQIDDLLKLLPEAFIWTETGSTANTTSLHFDPAPGFHPPTREARVFSSMTGDLVVDNQQHRICKIKGHLIHDVTFGGGILGRLKE